MKNKCSCYEVRTRKIQNCWPFPDHVEKYGVCLGTKECDECSCEGNEYLCDFYPEKRKITIKGELAQSISGNLEPAAIEIKNCEKIKLHHKEIDIDFELPKNVFENIDIITINGIKYVKEK